MGVQGEPPPGAPRVGAAGGSRLLHPFRRTVPVCEVINFVWLVCRTKRMMAAGGGRLLLWGNIYFDSSGLRL